MPDPANYPDKSSFMSDCIKIVMKEGKTREQAIAQCLNVWRRYKGEKMTTLSQCIEEVKADNPNLSDDHAKLICSTLKADHKLSKDNIELSIPFDLMTIEEPHVYEATAIVANKLLMHSDNSAVFVPIKELRKGYKTIEGVNVNLNHELTRIVGAAYRPRLEGKELKVRIKINDPITNELIQSKLRNKEIPEVSVRIWGHSGNMAMLGDTVVSLLYDVEFLHLAIVAEGACSGEQGCGVKLSNSTKVIDNTVEYECECLSCGYKMKTTEHCRDIKCPKCGGEMRRVERPGVGQSKDNKSTSNPWKIDISTANDVIIPNVTVTTSISSIDDLGVVPRNPANYGESTGTWTAPNLKDLTSKSWDKLTSEEKRKIASCFARSPKMSPDRFTDLKLPHHNPNGNVVKKGVSSALGALAGARGGVNIPSGDVAKVRAHLEAHSKEFKGEEEMAEDKPEVKSNEDIDSLKTQLEEMKKLISDLKVKEETPKPEPKPVLNPEIEGLKKKIEEMNKIISEKKEPDPAIEELKKKVSDLTKQNEKLAASLMKPRVSDEDNEPEKLSKDVINLGVAKAIRNRKFNFLAGFE